MGKGGRFPNLTGKEMVRILDKLCGNPVRIRGSHRHYRLERTGGEHMFSYHDSATVTGGIVRQILIKDFKLDMQEARKAVKKK